MPSELDPLSVFDEPGTPDVSNRKAVDIALAQDARKRSVKAEVLKALMEHERGREWVYDILERCHIFSTPFADDPYRTAFNAGEQNIGNIMLADVVGFEASKYVIMCQEGHQREQAYKEQINKAVANAE
jgi:hypothetical protein